MHKWDDENTDSFFDINTKYCMKTLNSNCPDLTMVINNKDAFPIGLKLRGPMCESNSLITINSCLFSMGCNWNIFID